MVFTENFFFFQNFFCFRCYGNGVTRKGEPVLMKPLLVSALLAALLLAQAAGCSGASAGSQATSPFPSSQSTQSPDPVSVQLSDDGVTVNGSAAEDGGPVAVGQTLRGADSGGSGSQTAVVITRPGTYRLSGTLTDGQVAVDLGPDAADDPTAVVTLILDGANITCSSAPALLFQHAYECADTEAAVTSPQVDTSAAGARILLADGSENSLTSTSAEAAGALVSAVSLTLSGQGSGDGLLTVSSSSAGIAGAVHLTLESGRLIVQAQNAGLEAAEEALSAITVNGGKLFVNAGQDGRSGGVVSGGYVVVNGGEVVALSADEGLSAHSGVQIHAGSVLALGNRVSPVDEGSEQPVLDWSFSAQQDAGIKLEITNESGETLLSYITERPCTAFLFSSPQLADPAACTVSADGVAVEPFASTP